MFRGIYTATSGMVASSRKQEMLSHNLANAETPGYKQDHTVLRAFPDILMYRIREEAGLNVEGKPSIQGQSPIGVLHTGVYAQEGIPLFRQGDLKETGRALDLAIIDQSLLNPQTQQKGYLFFGIQTAQGEIRYTRNGQFALDPEGYLTTSEGYYVLNDQQERIQLTQGDFTVTEDGRIIETINGFNSTVGSLSLAYTEEPQQMVKEGNGLFRYEGEAATLQNVADVDYLNDPANPLPYLFQIKQGYVERSNVDITMTMTEMMSTYRLYEANQKVLQAYDRSLDKTVNEVGRI